MESGHGTGDGGRGTLLRRPTRIQLQSSFVQSFAYGWKFEMVSKKLKTGHGHGAVSLSVSLSGGN